MNNKYQVTVQDDGRVGFSCESVQDAVALMRALRSDTKATTEVVPPVLTEKKRMGRPPGTKLKTTTKTNFSKMTSKDLGLKDRRARWTDDDIKRFHDLYTQGADRKLIVADPILTKNHSPNAINALYYSIKDDNYIRHGYDSAFYRKYDAYRRLAKGESLQEKQDAYNAGGETAAPFVPAMSWSRNQN